MALISCPNCGKQITDRMEKCIHCGATLIEPKESVKRAAPTIQLVAKDDMIGILSAAILTIVVYLYWSRVAFGLAAPFGEMAVAGFSYSSSAFFIGAFWVLLLEVVWLCLYPTALKKLAVHPMIIMLVSGVVFGFIGFFVQHHAVLRYANLTPEILRYSQIFAFAFGFTFPMLLGSLAISTYKRKLGIGLLIPLGLCVVFILLSMILGWFMVQTLKMNLSCISYSTLIAVVVVLILSALTNKRFQQWIAPKK